MQETCGNIKTILADLQGKGLSSTAKLVAILEACGVTDKDDLAAMLEIGGSTLRTAKAALKNERSKSSSARNQALENEQNARNQAETLENERSNSSVPLRAHATKESPTEISFTNVVKLASSREDLSETMITDIIGWMHGGDRLSAQNWLASTVKTFGQEATASGYHKLKTDLATGSVISRKLQAWSEIARRYKAKPEAPPQANYRSTPALDQTASIFEKIRAEAANAAG